MYRIGMVWLSALIIACGADKKQDESKQAAASNTLEDIGADFKKVSLPYLLSDTFFLKMKDTASIRTAAINSMIADSIRTKVFGKNAKVKFTPLARIEATDKETYLIVKGSAGGKKAAFLMAFAEGAHTATFPFLVPDDDRTTTQTSSIDKALSISKSVSRKSPDDVMLDGKDVFIYSADAKQFVLIMTDPLDDQKLELINPIDTLRKTAKFAGDYVKNKRNIVSIRDGRTPNQLVAFVHMETEEGDCSGELKGELLMTSANTAIYRQGGDPCVLEFQFSANGVTLREEEGCGNHRGLDCAFNGSFPRKKEAKPQTAKKKKK